MRVMCIGSSLINLENFISIEGRHTNDGVILTVEHDHSVKEYLVPDEIDPELVVAVIMNYMDHSYFDLPYVLESRRESVGND